MEARAPKAHELGPGTRQPVPPKGLNERLTLGFLTASIHVGIGRDLWRGVVDAAAQHDVNLLCFPGEGLHAPAEFEAQRNVIYDLVYPAHLSGLVNWSSTITVSLEPASVIAFHQRYRSLPMVSLGSPVEHIPTVLVDSYQGMCTEIIHLIEVHGFRRLLLNLLSNAQKFTERGHITLGAAVLPTRLHIWVEDTGIGIPADLQERIFEPFVTAERRRSVHQSGIGLGLSITRRLVALHHGTLTVEARPGAGSMFHVYLPLPGLSEQMTAERNQVHPVLLVFSTSADLPDEIVAFSRRQGLTLQRLPSGGDLESVLASVQPAALAWDLFGATPRDWALVRRLRQRQNGSQLPFLVYGHGQAEEAESGIGLTSFVAKPSSAKTLIDTIRAARTADATGPILIVDDDPAVRKLHHDVVAQGLPGYPIREAVDGPQALALMEEDVPSLVLLDLMMPGMEGIDVLDQMRTDPRLRQVPVVILSSKLLTLDDIKRLEQHAHVTLQSKGILSEEETIAMLQRLLGESDALPPQTSALVKRTVAYLHQHYTRQISRSELAKEVGVTEDYISRIFNRELGLSPWEYLNRYRIYHAKELLRRTNDSIGSISQQVGYNDQKYFSRVFRKLTGVGPKEFREQSELPT